MDEMLLAVEVTIRVRHKQKIHEQKKSELTELKMKICVQIKIAQGEAREGLLIWERMSPVVVPHRAQTHTT